MLKWVKKELNIIGVPIFPNLLVTNGILLNVSKIFEVTVCRENYLNYLKAKIDLFRSNKRLFEDLFSSDVTTTNVIDRLRKINITRNTFRIKIEGTLIIKNWFN